MRETYLACQVQGCGGTKSLLNAPMASLKLGPPQQQRGPAYKLSALPVVVRMPYGCLSSIRDKHGLTVTTGSLLACPHQWKANGRTAQTVKPQLTLGNSASDCAGIQIERFIFLQDTQGMKCHHLHWPLADVLATVVETVVEASPLVKPWHSSMRCIVCSLNS